MTLTIDVLYLDESAVGVDFLGCWRVELISLRDVKLVSGSDERVCWLVDTIKHA